ncbi:MAG TPA: DoxX family protein [Gemmataceae bacterium]|nr:DoxX family protein [Gemmataceae bacterium]
MNKLTAFFLLLLRLAIGWHFAAEGFHKLKDYWKGPAETVAGISKPWTSAGYFREGAGPLAQYIRKEIGDPDDEALALLTPAPNKQMPPLLAQEWGDFVHNFGDHYGLNEDQRKKADEALKKAEAAAVDWLTRATVDEKNYQAKTQEGQLPVPARLALYKQKLEELSEPKHSHLVSIGSDAESVRLHNVKTEAVRLRVGLLSDLDEYTKDLRKELEKIPTDEQKQQAEGKGKPPQPEPPAKKFDKQKWIDLATMYGLTVVGACLILGLFTRLSCLLAAGFLLMTYLSFPPFPWLPTPPNNEGYYLFVNKNVIEMLALLALATTRSGRWLGLDAIVHWMLFGSRSPAARG